MNTTIHAAEKKFQCAPLVLISSMVLLAFAPLSLWWSWGSYWVLAFYALALVLGLLFTIFEDIVSDRIVSTQNEFLLRFGEYFTYTLSVAVAIPIGILVYHEMNSGAGVISGLIIAVLMTLALLRGWNHFFEQESSDASLLAKLLCPVFLGATLVWILAGSTIPSKHVQFYDDRLTWHEHTTLDWPMNHDIPLLDTTVQRTVIVDFSDVHWRGHVTLTVTNPQELTELQWWHYWNLISSGPVIGYIGSGAPATRDKLLLQFKLYFPYLTYDATVTHTATGENAE